MGQRDASFPEVCLRCIINCPTTSHECGITPSAAAIVEQMGFPYCQGYVPTLSAHALNAESGRPIVICPVSCTVIARGDMHI